MKKTDIMTPAGFVLGAALIGYGIVSGGPFSIFIDIPSIFICVGGSLSALFITYTMDEIKEMFGSLGNAFKESSASQKDIIVQFSNLSQRARKDGLLSLEEDISNLEDPFLKKGMQMVVDGIEPETIKEILELDIYETENRGMNVAGMYSAWGGYAPGFGMIGTLIPINAPITHPTIIATKIIFIPPQHLKIYITFQNYISIFLFFYLFPY